MRALEKHAQELKQEWQGKLVELEDMHGYTGDGQVADIHVEYLCYEHWFKDKKMHITITWVLNPVRYTSSSKERAIVSSHKESFYNPTKIKEVTDWTKIAR